MKITTISLFSLLTISVAIGAQTPTSKPAFEVASIKPSTATRPRLAPMPSGRLVATGVSLQGLAAGAYRGQQIEFSNAASWTDSDLWDIEAKAPEGAKIIFDRFDLATPDTMDLMLQSLLEERFQLKMHHVSRELPVYELMLAKGGPKMKLSADQSAPTLPDMSGPPPTPGSPLPRGIMRMGRGVLEVSGISFANLVLTLGAISGKPVIDKTGLKGFYDVKLQWTPDAIDGTSGGPFGPATPASTAAPSDLVGPSLFAAIQEQLGLKLEPAKGPIDILVIESAQKPRIN